MSQQDYLFELGCEELPPMALAKMENSLKNSVESALQQQGLAFETIESFATPRRLAILVRALASQQADKSVERLGPAVAAAFDEDGQPRPAALGFARSCGVEVSQLARKKTDKGERLAYTLEEKGRAATDLLPGIMQKAVAALPVPKAMRWGDENYQFSRPVHWLVSLFGEKIVPIEILGLSAGNQTYGHRFHAPQAITLAVAGDYEQALNQAKVLANRKLRSEKIEAQVKSLAEQNNAVTEIDPDLLQEVTALVEWPVALLGAFDQEFLQVPAEALISSMAEHQKYFHLRDRDGQLKANFITISNIESKHPESVITGNEKVIRPRLADAKFFFDTDSKRSLESRIESTKSVLFQKQLGSLYDKSVRVGKLATAMAETSGLDTDTVSRAAALCKCDLMTDMVYEFTDLQGIMGRYYALNDGESAEVAAAMDEIYMPRFAGDQLPSTNTGTLLAIAERIDTLVGIFGIGQIPTGAKDPFGLRRATLGVIRILVEKSLSFDFSWLLDQSLASFDGIELMPNTKQNLIEYFNTRMTVWLQEQGVSTQAIQSVLALGLTEPLDITLRAKAVEAFAQREEAADLSQANKRVANILAKAGEDDIAEQTDSKLFGEEESRLMDAIESTRQMIEPMVAAANYQAALDKLAELKPVVNAFFDEVMINAEDAAIKRNRFALISQLRNLFLLVADVSLLQK